MSYGTVTYWERFCFLSVHRRPSQLAPRPSQLAPEALPAGSEAFPSCFQGPPSWHLDPSPPPLAPGPTQLHPRATQLHRKPSHLAAWPFQHHLGPTQLFPRLSQLPQRPYMRSLWPLFSLAMVIVPYWAGSQTSKRLNIIEADGTAEHVTLLRLLFLFPQMCYQNWILPLAVNNGRKKKKREKSLPDDVMID